MIKNKSATQVLTITAIFLAMNIVLSSFSLPVPGGHVYLNDTAIMLAAVVLRPKYAFIAGGFGAFLADYFFYPTTMIFSLIIHGAQGYVMSAMLRNYKGLKVKQFTCFAFIIGEIITIVGYSLAKIFFYSTVEYAIMKLPFEFIQAVVTTTIAMVIVFQPRLRKYFTGLY